MEEKITVNMTADYLFDFTLYHTYSKFAGFLTNVLGLAIAFMGIIMMVMGKIHGVQLVVYLLAAAAFIAYTPAAFENACEEAGAGDRAVQCPECIYLRGRGNHGGLRGKGEVLCVGADPEGDHDAEDHRILL